MNYDDKLEVLLMRYETIFAASVSPEKVVDMDTSSTPQADGIHAGQTGAGCPAAFEAIYEQYYDRTFRLALRITRNLHDAEDVVQECFMRAFKYLDRFAGKSRLSTWVSRIAINAALMKIRQRRRSEFSLQEIAETLWAARNVETECHRRAPDEEYLRREFAQTLAEGLAELSPALYRVVDLHYFEELSARECSKVLGISLSSAKSRILRARLKLRPAFNKRFRRQTAPSRLHRYPRCSFQSLNRETARCAGAAAKTN